MRDIEEQIYLDFWYKVKGFEGHLNFKDIEIIRDIYSRLDEDSERWKQFLNEIPKMKDTWTYENLSLNTINTNYNKIRSSAWPMSHSGGSNIRSRAFPEMTKDDIEWRIYYDGFRERSQAAVQAKKAQLKIVRDE